MDHYKPLMFSNNNFTIHNLTRASPTSLHNTSGEQPSPVRVCLSKGTSGQHESRRASWSRGHRL